MREKTLIAWVAGLIAIIGCLVLRLCFVKTESRDTPAPLAPLLASNFIGDYFPVQLDKIGRILGECSQATGRGLSISQIRGGGLKFVISRNGQAENFICYFDE